MAAGDAAEVVLEICDLASFARVAVSCVTRRATSSAIAPSCAEVATATTTVGKVVTATANGTTTDGPTLVIAHLVIIAVVEVTTSKEAGWPPHLGAIIQGHPRLRESIGLKTATIVMSEA